MQIVEFFGLPGVGKTTIKNLLQKEFFVQGYTVYDYKNIILKFSATIIKLSIKERLVLIYFQFIKCKFIKRVKLNFKEKKQKKSKKKQKIYILKSFNLIYRKICFNIFKKFKKENKKFANYVLEIISNSGYPDRQKNIMKDWFIEECSAVYLAKKNREKIDIVLDSEGFIQRSMLYFCNMTFKHLYYNIRKYINYMPLPNTIFYVEKKIKNQKKIKDNYFYVPTDTQKKIFNLIYYHLKKKILKNRPKIKLIKLVNNKKNFIDLNNIQKKIDINIK